MNHFTGYVFGLALCLIVGGAGAQAPAPEGSWSAKAPMPTPRHTFPGIGVAGGILHVLGGWDGSSVVATHEAYAPSTNAWATKAPMGSARYAPGVGVIDGIVYAVGGSGLAFCGGGFLASLEAYDPATDAWTGKPPMPTARCAPSVEVVNGVLYAVGGWDGAQQLATVEAYDPATGTWSTKAPMPTARHGMATGVIGGIIYVAGGYNADRSDGTTVVEAYDPATDTWSTRAPMPTPRHGAGGGVIDGRFHVVGGSGGANVGAPLTIHEVYDPMADSWSVGPAMPTARTGLVAGGADGVLYAIGGLVTTEGPVPTAANEAFTSLQKVIIDIKPGSPSNALNPASAGVIPVAILTTPAFDASNVAAPTVRFGALPPAAPPVHFALEDVDGDGDIDMILHFDTRATRIACVDRFGHLTGRTLRGKAIAGSDGIATVGCR